MLGQYAGPRIYSRCVPAYRLPNGANLLRSISQQPHIHPISRSRRFFNYFLLPFTALAAGGLTYDHYFQADALRRSLLTLYTGIAIAIDYKLNFRPERTAEINAMHQRVADRLYYLCTTNAGLYIKLGQALGMQAALMPKCYSEAFANIFDAAPQIPYEEVASVIRTEFGRSPEELFASFDQKSIAAASIAQVHRATLKDGTVVAVKVQRPAIQKQMEWDLFSYRMLMTAYEWLFEIPCAFVSEYVAQQMRLETKFIAEAQNAERISAFFSQEPSLRDRVSVPRVHWNLTTDRVMTADFVVGACKISDKKQMEKWGLDVSQAMKTVIEAFSAMMFKAGSVHCDCHPGNILIRPRKDKPKEPEIIIIDHGLYIHLSDEFRHDYSLLWRSLIALDPDMVDKIAHKWGIGNSDMFASATLLRPFRLRRKKPSSDGSVPEKKSDFEAQLSVKHRLKSMLENEALIPRELIFLTRCMRMLQANNQLLGSPVNRINIIAHWAVIGLADTTNPVKKGLTGVSQKGLQAWTRDKLRIWTFRLTLIAIDIGFFFSKIWQRFFSPTNEGFEDLLQQQISSMAKNEFGIELQDDAFLG